MTGPSGMVVPLQDLKDHLRYLSNDQDSLISQLHDVAVKEVEHRTRRQLLTATWKLYLSGFPTVIQIRKCPVASVTSITYTDTDGSTQTVDSSIYDTFLQREPGEIHQAYSQTWPITRIEDQSATVTFTAGYGGQEDVPDIAKHCIKLIVEQEFHGEHKNEQAIDRLMSMLHWGM